MWGPGRLGAAADDDDDDDEWWPPPEKPLGVRLLEAMTITAVTVTVTKAIEWAYERVLGEDDGDKKDG